MKKVWNKGLTKHTSASVLKTSRTMKRKRIDNFLQWREQMKQEGKIRSRYPELRRDENLAELIGVVLGDGHIRKFPRTEELSIFSNSNNQGFIKRYAGLVEEIFSKKPAITRHGGDGCTRIRIYQKNIQSRIGVPYSPRGKRKIGIPKWISTNDKNIVRYLRGLYEAEGSYSVHEPTYTHKMLFSNRNQSMLKNVFRLVKKLGFHPHMGKCQVQISRKEEVVRFLSLIQFRKY